MATYGSDKPDRRLAMPIHDITHVSGLGASGFSPVAEAVATAATGAGDEGSIASASAGSVRVLNAKRLGCLSRKNLDALMRSLKGHAESNAAAATVVPVKIQGGAWKSSVAKHFDTSVQVRAPTGGWIDLLPDYPAMLCSCLFFASRCEPGCHQRVGRGRRR